MLWPFLESRIPRLTPFTRRVGYPRISALLPFSGDYESIPVLSECGAVARTLIQPPSLSLALYLLTYCFSTYLTRYLCVIIPIHAQTKSYRAKMPSSGDEHESDNPPWYANHPDGRWNPGGVPDRLFRHPVIIQRQIHLGDAVQPVRSSSEYSNI